MYSYYQTFPTHPYYIRRHRQVTIANLKFAVSISGCYHIFSMIIWGKSTTLSLTIDNNNDCGDANNIHSIGGRSTGRSK